MTDRTIGQSRCVKLFKTHSSKRSIPEEDHLRERLRRRAKLERSLERSKSARIGKGRPREFAETLAETHPPSGKRRVSEGKVRRGELRFIARLEQRASLESFAEDDFYLNVADYSHDAFVHMLRVFLNVTFTIIDGNPLRQLPKVSWVPKCLDLRSDPLWFNFYFGSKTILVKNVLKGITVFNLRSASTGEVRIISRQIVEWVRSEAEPTSDISDWKHAVAWLEKRAAFQEEFFEEVGSECSRRLLVALRVLLLIAGVEPNPGPGAEDGHATKDVRTNQGQKGKNRVVKLKTRSSANRGRNQLAAVWQEAKEDHQRMAGELDAMKDKLSEAREESSRVKKVLDDTNTQLAEARSLVSLCQDKGLIAEVMVDPIAVYSFFGKFSGLDSIYGEDNPQCKRIDVKIYGDFSISFVLAGTVAHRLRLTKVFFSVASLASITSNPSARMRNIRQAFISNKAIHDLISEDPLSYGQNLDLVAFLLAGWSELSGNTRFLNDVDEWVPVKYQCTPPDDWATRLKDVIFAKDLTAVKASMDRKVRRMPFYVRNLCPHICDWPDFGTLVSGLCKRLYPDTPAVGRDPDDGQPVAVKLAQLAADLADYIEAHWRDDSPRSEFTDDRTKLIEEALKGRPKRERDGIMEGVVFFNENPAEAIKWYNSLVYSAFFKLESYPEGSFKPPRFIMSLPLKARGVQIAAMCLILWKVERGTYKCNIKHMAVDLIKTFLDEKFSHYGLCIETDYSSFESCISPIIKGVVENNIFLRLSETDEERMFISCCLSRKTVSVKGPGFYIPDFHHIRMSGDYWTSLGNLLTNIVVMSYLLKRPVDWVVENCCFEGDDGMAPSPTLDGLSLQDFAERARSAGMLLKFLEGNYRSLSFCGHQFEDIDGVLYRSRDSLKTLTNLFTWFGCDPTTDKEALMLERSKCLCVLSGPWVKGASAFAACVEYLSRGLRVRERYLLKHGMLKEYSSYQLESCISSDLASCDTDKKLVNYILKREKLVHGPFDPGFVYSSWKKSNAFKLLSQLRSSGGCDLDLFKAQPSSCQFVARIGLKSTHPFFVEDVWDLPKCCFNLKQQVNPRMLRHTAGVTTRAPLFEFKLWHKLLLVLLLALGLSTVYKHTAGPSELNAQQQHDLRICLQSNNCWNPNERVCHPRVLVDPAGPLVCPPGALDKRDLWHLNEKRVAERSTHHPRRGILLAQASAADDNADPMRMSEMFQLTCDADEETTSFASSDVDQLVEHYDEIMYYHHRGGAFDTLVNLVRESINAVMDVDYALQMILESLLVLLMGWFMSRYGWIPFIAFSFISLVVSAFVFNSALSRWVLETVRNLDILDVLMWLGEHVPYGVDMIIGCGKFVWFMCGVDAYFYEFIYFAWDRVGSFYSMLLLAFTSVSWGEVAGEIGLLIWAVLHKCWNFIRMEF